MGLSGKSFRRQSADGTDGGRKNRMRTENMQKTRIEWIDQAKGIAILMVILVHLSQILPLPRYMREVASFGALGVQLFFILSAYCLCLADKGEGWSFAYLMRKYRRFCPWYWAGIVLYFCHGWINGDVSAYTAGNIGANMLLINDFIPSAQNSIVPGGWSISCIALFAFIFPLIRQVRLAILAGFGFLGVSIAFLGGTFFGWSRFFAYCCPFNQFIVFVFGIALWRCRNVLNTLCSRPSFSTGHTPFTIGRSWSRSFSYADWRFCDAILRKGGLGGP